MLQIIASWIISALALFIVTKIVPGVRVDGFGTAMIAVLVIGLINALIKPILFLFTLPINILTLGLFTFVINAVLLQLAAYVVPDFHVDGFIAALIGSIVLSVVSTLLHSFVR